jgi:hypothetical protein
MKILFFALLLALFSNKTSVAQLGIEASRETGTSKWVHSDGKSGIKITYAFELQQVRETTLLVNLTIEDKSENIIYNYGSFELTAQNVLNTKELSNLLKRRYFGLFTQYGKSALEKHNSHLNAMVLKIKDTLKTRNHHSFVFQALRMYQTIAKGAKRDIKNTGSINFTVFGGYKNGICSFECEEDMTFNIGDFKRYLIDRKSADINNKGIDYYLGALENETAATLNFSEISDRLTSYFEREGFPIREQPAGDSDVPNARWPQGGECGCCGNYSGNCYFWSKLCLAHDMACQQCQWQACFNGCVPSSCSGNTIAWYWWIL